ncbi:MAG: rod shape-determining protein MreC [Deltaproteobacteria bacterium RIFOXYA12_FULL_58_15]|nr:MAG: rod shape-determining protein MreC [Deltaproteobacteria bacterium RIFOXYA12_FULL_58_15]OGR08450.1 MAG: rod shape-determining protein MreC [Deltaproteobacteria bacterium RIFOXYB12_FULL_58_9]
MVVLILLALPFVFYVSNSKVSRDHNVFDRMVVWVSAPVQWLTVAVVDGVSGAWNHYIHLVGVQEQNQALLVENANLKLEVLRRDEFRLENDRLRNLIGLRERAAEVKAIAAQVIAVSPTPAFRSIRVDRGTDDGGHLGAAVVGRHGLVGRIAAISGGWADVMLLVDANSSVDVVVQRTRAHARVRGRGGDGNLGIDVEHLSRTNDVEPGDVLMTSGSGSVFPKGLRVGTIVSVERGRFGLYQRAAALPSADFDRIEEVMILPGGWPRESSFEDGADLESNGAVPEANGAVPEANGAVPEANGAVPEANGAVPKANATVLGEGVNP